MGGTSETAGRRIEAEALTYLLAVARQKAEDAAFVLIDGAGVTPSGFGDPTYATIYRVVEQLYMDGESITPSRIVELVPKPQQSETLKALDALEAAAPVSQDTFEQHLGEIANQAHRRELSDIATAAQVGLDAGQPPAVVEEQLRTALERHSARGLRVWSQAERWDEFDARGAAGSLIIPIDHAFRLHQPPLSAEATETEHPAAAAWRSSGRPTLRTLLNGGLHPGELIAIAGTTGGGKSTFALQLADSVAADNVGRLRAGKPIVPVLYVALELDGHDLLEMSLARLACVSSGALHGGGYAASPAAQAAVQAALARYRETTAPYLRVMDSEFYGYDDVTLDTIRRQVRRAKVDFGAETAAVFVDPLQRLVTGRRDIDQDENARTSQIAKGLHTLAKRERVAVVALSDSTRLPVTGVEGPGATREISFRGSYVLNHLADLTLYLDAGDEFHEIFPELSKGGSFKGPGTPTVKQERLVERVRHALRDFPLEGPTHNYMRDFKSQYAATLCAKRRWEEPFSPFFLYHRTIRCFEELPV